MPFYDVEDRPVTASIGVAPLEDLTVAPAAQPVNPNGPSVLGASYRQDNIIGSIMSRKDAGITFDMEDGFNPFDRIKGTKYEQRPELFTDIFNTKALSARQAQIDMEDEDRAVLARSGWKGVAASFMWQFFDPTILAPGGGLVKAARGGYSFARSAASIGLAAAGGAALQEGILQSTQQTRPLEESAIAVGSSLVLGGLLGGTAAGLLSRAEARAADRGYRVLSQAMSGEAPAAVAGGSVVAPLADLASKVRAGEQISSSEIVEAARVAALQARQSGMGVERLARIDDVIEPMLRNLEREAIRSDASELVTAAKQAFGSDAARLIDQGGVRVVQSVEDLPARADGRAHPADVRGVYDGNTAYLVADNVAPGEVKGVLLHEVGVHYGMERMIGADNFRVLLDDITARAQAGEARFADALAAVPKDTPPQHVAEEVLAYLVENAPETGIVQRVITAVKQFVRQAFGGKFSGLSEDDIRALAVSALRKWKPDAQPAQLKQPRYSRAQSLADVQKMADERGVTLDASERNGIITLSRIVVPEGKRNGGIGSQIMRSMIEYADSKGLPIALTPDAAFGGNKGQLEKWYRSLGFVPNKGKAKNFATRESMIREPQGVRYSRAGEDAYIKRILGTKGRVADEERPNLGMGDMYGMAPKGAKTVATKTVPGLGEVRFVEKNGDVYALARNPDLDEIDVVGYAMRRGDGTELAVVNEAQGLGIGEELSFQYRKRAPYAPSGGLTEAGERTARKVYQRLVDEGVLKDDGKYSRGGNRNERIASQLDDLVRALQGVDDPAAFAGAVASRGAAAGAEFADRPTLEDLSIAGTGARAYAAATKFLNPNLRANFRGAVTARQYTQQLLENSVFQSMHADNRTLGSAVETMMRQEFRSRVIASARAADEIYAAGRKAGMQMTRRDFDEAVAKAMRREDIGENEFVSKAAASYRKEMFDHFKEMAQNTLGKDGKSLLPADLEVVGAPSYLTRMPNHERLTADEMGFKETVARYYEGVFRNEYEQHANATRTRIAALEREIADLNLAPEDRAKTLADIEKRLADMETANAREIDLLSEINRYRQQAVKAGERGDKKAQKAAKEEASKLFEQGGDNLRAFLKERTALRQRQRRIDLNYAGMQEREDRIAQQIADIEERNLRAMTRLIDRGQKAEREFAKLDPSIKAEKIAALRTQFGEVAKRSEQAADRLAEQAKKVALDEIAALKRQMAERKAKEAPPKQLTKSGRAMGARPVSLVEFIRKNGGLPLDGEAKARNLKGGLATKDGKSIDGFWREKLIENGYLPKEADGGMSRDITDELFAAIDKELRGQKVYSAFDQEAVARRMGANNPDELDMLTSNVLGALEEVGIRGKEVDERALIDAAVAVAGNKALDPLDAYEQAVIKLSREAEDKPVVNVEDLVKRLRGPKMETVEKRKAALAASIQKNAVAERARSEKLNAIARRLDEAEALDPDGQALELKRALNELAAMTSGTSLDRGAKAQRLMDRAKALDPKKLDERIKTIEAMKSDIQKEFDDRWFRRRGGEGVDLENPAAKVSFRDYAEDVARQIYDHYTGRSEASGTVPDFAVPLASGPLKERTFNIPDKLIEPWLENDIRRISDRYARTMAAQIELTRKFGRADMRDQLIAITQEYRDLREQVGLAKTADEALQIVGQKKGALDSLQASLRRQDINKATKERILAWLNEDEAGAKRDLEAGRDLLLGRYKMDEARSDFARITDGLLAFNYARAMGGAVIANLGDIYRSAMVNGLGRFMSDGVKPLLTNIEGFRASVKEAQLAGQVGEKWLHQRLATFAEIGDPYSKGTALGRMMENMSRVATKWNGLALFTDFSKSLASVTTQNRLIEAVSGGKEQRWLRWAGIDGYMEGRIKEQLATHGRTIDGVRVAETTKWTDPEAVRAYRAAVSKTVDTISVERSVGDVPLFVNTPIGKLIAQFRTFNLAANQRVLLNGMQEDKARFVGSLIAMTTIGMMVATLRSWRGGEERWNKFKESATNPGFLLGEGLDNSGIFTIPFEMANTIEKLTQPSGFSFNPIKTPMMAAFPGKSQQGESSRFASRDPIGALLGPSAGLPMTLAKALGGDVKAGTQLIPFSTYPGMREAVQALTGDSPYGF